MIKDKIDTKNAAQSTISKAHKIWPMMVMKRLRAPSASKIKPQIFKTPPKVGVLSGWKIKKGFRWWPSK